MSPSEKTLTEREAVKRERAAYEAGLCVAMFPPGEAEAMAAARYPFPSRPRPVRDPHNPNYSWRVVDGEIQFRYGDGTPWQRVSPSWGVSTVTPERAPLLADLLANPNETVEDDE